MRSFQRRRDGSIEARLSPAEAEIVCDLARQLRAALEAEGRDETLRRLFPPAYEDDEEAQAEYARLTSDDLRAVRLRAIEGVLETFEHPQGRKQAMDEERASQLLGVLNDARLALGTKLDVREDLREIYARASDEQAAALQLYEYLGWLEEQLVEALAGSR